MKQVSKLDSWQFCQIICQIILLLLLKLALKLKSTLLCQETWSVIIQSLLVYYSIMHKYLNTKRLVGPSIPLPYFPQKCTWNMIHPLYVSDLHAKALWDHSMSILKDKIGFECDLWKSLVLFLTNTKIYSSSSLRKRNYFFDAEAIFYTKPFWLILLLSWAMITLRI